MTDIDSALVSELHVASKSLASSNRESRRKMRLASRAEQDGRAAELAERQPTNTGGRGETLAGDHHPRDSHSPPATPIISIACRLSCATHGRMDSGTSALYWSMLASLRTRRGGARARSGLES
ncbi:hypothetical protein THAOC_04213 [Thalassiosira oceanica]|uniref:Uncharacterized protein n=1 Tax=Thalassiosira oceanica TaxID=159749 RepID=K0T9D8_THAOC|nr:hypothetical protein THAOC_04213 [Thalassiosira oceanica]|eukprot:EJK74130.1 hypothetical protein THAOC_04213 [Thalassiosira oceanica]